jgi:hypothetical protein
MPTKLRSRSHDDNLLEPDLQRENAELKRDLESLRYSKIKLAEKNGCLKNHVQKLELQLAQYKTLCEKMQSDSVTSDKMEIENLRQQLEVVLLVKEALHDENLELRHRLESSQLQERHTSPGVCVVCMDNLANVVCMPCRHGALCSECAELDEVKTCPVCREEVAEKLVIFLP